MDISKVQKIISGCVVAGSIIAPFVFHQAFAQQPESGKKFANGMVLDLYTLNDPWTEAGLGPSGRSVGAVIDRNVPTMNYGAASDIDPDFKTYTGSWYGQLWSGYLRVLGQGPHTLNLQFTFDPAGTLSHVSCVSKMYFDGEEVVQYIHKASNTTEKEFGNVFHDEALKPGLYKIGVWLACNKGHIKTYSQIEVMLKMRGPNDRKQRPIPSENLFYIEN